MIEFCKPVYYDPNIWDKLVKKYSEGGCGLEVRLLRYFLAITYEESITKAAQTLNITQPTLSRQMMQLEKELGVTLFIRGKNKITLTNEGAFLEGKAHEILGLIDKTAEELSNSDTFHK